VALGSDMLLYYHVFFFQAEDGIRDRNVTGVQTCALPISCCRGWPSVSVAKPGNTRGQYRPLLCGAVYRNKSGQPYPRASRVISRDARILARNRYCDLTGHRCRRRSWSSAPCPTIGLRIAESSAPRIPPTKESYEHFPLFDHLRRHWILNSLGPPDHFYPRGPCPARCCCNRYCWHLRCWNLAYRRN